MHFLHNHIVNNNTDSNNNTNPTSNELTLELFKDKDGKIGFRDAQTKKTIVECKYDSI